METIVAFLAELGHEQIVTQYIAPNVNAVTFAKALNRSVTGSINELLVHAEYDLAERPIVARGSEKTNRCADVSTL